MKPRNRTIALRQDTGFTMLEVLVAVLILSVGLLGLAGIYVASVQNTKSANIRTLAAQQSYDMADRMRVNLGALTVLAPVVPYYHLPAAVQSTTCYTATCTSQQMAQNDYYEWNDPASPTSNPRVLPGGYGIVCLDDSNPDTGTWNGAAVTHGCSGLGTTYRIKVWWLEKAATDVQPATYQRLVTTFQPQP